MSAQQDKLIALGKELFAKKAKRAKLEDEIKKLNLEIGEIETKTLAKLMEDGEIEKFTVKGRGTVYLSNELYVNVLADDRSKLYDELRAGGNEAMIVDWVFPQTLKAFCKEQLTLGRALPEAVKATYIPTAKTRSKS